VNAALRAGAVFDAAHRRSPSAVMPGHVMSPMDRECTVTIDSDLIASCQSVATTGELGIDPELPRGDAAERSGRADHRAR